MDISPHALCRVFTHMCTLLHLQVPPFEPLSILPRLQSHIMALTTQPNSPLPKALISMLQPLPPVPVLRLASSLAIILSHLDGFSSAGPSACPTACALFIMALEGQAASSLPSYTILAQELGVKAGARRDLVIERYRDVSKILEQWMAEVPWLSNADHPDNKLGSRRRKISRRDVIASGIRDVVQFREDIMRTQKSRETTTPITVALEVGEEDDSGGSLDSLTRSGLKRKRSDDPDFSCSTASLRLIRRCPSRRSMDRMDLASLSLLSPSHPFSLDFPSPEMSEDPQADTLQNQILTASTSPADVTLTRLQQLAVSRGGENEIRDDELFEQDELESFLRSENEVIQLRGLFGWDEPDPRVAGAHIPAAQPSSKCFDWESADLTVWEDIGIDTDVDNQSGEQILGEWREASPFPENVGEDSDTFDVCGEW
jgi:transcription factor IIIB 90 kDa subunit